MNCSVYYNTRQRMFFFMTSSGSIDYLYGCFRSTNELLDKSPLIITQAFKTSLDHYANNPNCLLLGDYFIQDNYNHNLKETILSDYPELFI